MVKNCDAAGVRLVGRLDGDGDETRLGDGDAVGPAAVAARDRRSRAAWARSGRRSRRCRAGWRAALVANTRLLRAWNAAISACASPSAGVRPIGTRSIGLAVGRRRRQRPAQARAQSATSESERGPVHGREPRPCTGTRDVAEDVNVRLSAPRRAARAARRAAGARAGARRRRAISEAARPRAADAP